MDSIQKTRNRIISMLLVIALSFGSFLTYQIDLAEAASDDTIQLRFISTSDIHGQVNTVDYEKGAEYKVGSLAKAYTLIKSARSEVGASNAFTFDTGDNLYDYSTEYIFSEDQKAVQPVYKALAKIGYDAITLGNHEFDYGYNYLLTQLEGSGMMKKVVVSNIVDAQTEDHVWNENMMITRTVKTKKGKSVKVNIGVIGEAIPTLTTKTENYTGILKTEDIVENTKKQAAKLKKQGADIIVVLAHSGMGEEEPKLMDANVSYALTKIPEVDIIMCGHQHNIFPNKDASGSYYKLSGVDRKTGLINGKNVVMPGDRGRGIGVVDLTLNIGEDKKEIVNRSSEIRVVKSSTKADKNIANVYGNWESKLLEFSRKVIGNISSGERITNFFGLVEDNTALQLVNDAKRSYALNYIFTKNEKYKDYPVIAASYYNRFGQNSKNDYVNMSGSITESDLSSIQIFNNYIALYEISGGQLKEWLEWMASAFDTTSSSDTWDDATMKSLMKSNQISSLVSEQWLTDWSGFRIFDGVEYVIDPSYKPRYNKAGQKINNSNRITQLTYNGKKVTDSMKFVLATDRITQTTEATKGIDNQYIVKGFNRTLAVLGDYVEFLNRMGSINPVVDYNWRVSLKADQKFLVRSSSAADSIVKEQRWYQNTLTSIGDYSYHVGLFKNLHIDTQAPSVVVSPTINENTNQSILVVVDATDNSGVKEVKYHVGDYDVDSSLWSTGREIKDRSFTAYNNGIYSIYAEDKVGNKSVTKIKIDNIEKTLLQAPVVKTYTNRKSKISGTAEPNSTIYFVTAEKTYESKVDSNGTFSYALPNQPSDTTISVYVVDAEGRESSKRSVKVKRTGPNRPTINAIKNNMSEVTGKTNDLATSVFFMASNAKSNIYDLYISKDDIELYEKSEAFNPQYNVIETDIKVNASGKYTAAINGLPSGTKVTVYAIDYLNRVSRKRDTTVVEVAPNMPRVFEITDVENTLRGRIPGAAKNTSYSIYAAIAGEDYQGETDEDGYFSIPIEKAPAGTIIKVYTKDRIEETERKSATAVLEVNPIEDYIVKNSNITIDALTNKKDQITGTYEPYESMYVATADEVYPVTANDEGEFILDLQKRLKADTKVYAYSAFHDGGIYQATSVVVKAGKPDMPYILEDAIWNYTKKIQVVSEEKLTINIKLGKETITSKEGVYNSEIKGYVYNIAIPKTNSGTKLTVTAKNKVGTSKALSLTILKGAPDAPKVDKIEEKAKTITGSIDIVSVDFSEETVEGTQTKVFAMIDKETYEGDIKEDGTFKIKIPEQKKKTKITVWGENKTGVGPSTAVTVK